VALAVQRVSASPHHATSDLLMTSVDKFNNQGIVAMVVESYETWWVERRVLCGSEASPEAKKKGSVPKPRWMENRSQETGPWQLGFHPNPTRHRTLSGETVQF
jgi:hypothetical protein